MPRERVITNGPGGRILTNTGVWSPDGQWIVFDTRSDPAGAVFDGTHIQAVHVQSGEVRTLYQSLHGACCGVATWHPHEEKVAFIHGPEYPTTEWSYGPSRRQGVWVDLAVPGLAHALDARDLVPPYTPGALRGGSHVHVWHPHGELLSCTYDDDVLQPHTDPTSAAHINQRNVAVLFPQPVLVPKTHPRNHDGACFSVVVTHTMNSPRPGTDEISKACEEAWLGSTRSVAFQGTVNHKGTMVTEVFLVELPDDLTVAGEAPLQGTPTTRHAPPRGTRQRRLTFTAMRPHPGLAGPRHWHRSNPAGTMIAFIAYDDAARPQLFTVEPTTYAVHQLTHGCQSPQSAFTWHPSGQFIAVVIEQSVCIVDVESKGIVRLTEPCQAAHAPRPEAVVFSPTGEQIAFVRRLPYGNTSTNQICMIATP
jgi:hypothetical protein